METYELSAHDFETLGKALAARIGILAMTFETVAVKGIYTAESEVAAKELNRARDLRDKLSEAHTAWLEFE
jgi:hypothetical protein